MSAPVSGFSKLSLTQDMQSSRSHVRGSSGERGKGKAPMGAGGPSRLTSIPSILNDSVDEDLDEEEPDEGNQSGRVFALDHCRHIGELYAFQIAYAEVERISIRISTTGPACSSDTCKEKRTCRHIMWLLEQLSHAIPDAIDANTMTPYEQISTMGLGNVCEELHWEAREGPDSDTEDTWQLKKVYSTSGTSRQTRGMIRERMIVVRDIMATLSTELTEDYRKDIFEDGERISPEPVMGDLEATISRLLILDDDMFYHFKTRVSHTMRALEFFKKAFLKAQTACDSLDRYCEDGPAAGPFDLVWCANKLIDIVNSISINVVQRQPLTLAAKEEAAKALVGILGMVVNRNFDVYQTVSWPRRRAHAEPQIDRNLYERLIRNPPRNSPTSGDFVLNALQNLPEAQPFIEELEVILGQLEGIGWDAPPAYIGKLQRIIAQLKGVSPIAGPGPGPSVPSGKRPAGSGDRKANKRMK